MDLSTTYMGLKLSNPIIASASPLSKTVDSIKQMEDAGVGAVVMFSLFEEQIRQEEAALDHFLSYGTDSFSEALSYFPEPEAYEVGPSEYLDVVRRAADSCDIPIIGSLNGVSREGWIDYAKQIEDAGAKGLELNVYFIPTSLDSSSADIEQMYIDVLRGVKASVSIPVAMKLSPYFSSMANMAKRLDEAGADALVLFNRFYQPDFNIYEMEVDPTLELSTPKELRLPLLWTAVLYGKLQASLAAGTGVHSAVEVIKYLMAGADAVMTASAMLTGGPRVVTQMRNDLSAWMLDREYESVTQMQGCMSRASVADPQAFERANYIKILEKFKNEYQLV